MSTNEWYTPAEYIEAAREVMGSIELDPASCAFANRTVRAERYYSKEDNGLMHEWVCRSLWLNPPYGKTVQGGKSNLEIFTRYLMAQYECGNVEEAILLIPNNSGTRWFPPLWKHPICMPDFRIRFNTEVGKSDGAAFATCFVYFGRNEHRFVEVFSTYGDIVRSILRREVYVTLPGLKTRGFSLQRER